MNQPADFWATYEQIENLYKARQYQRAAEQAYTLLRDVLARIYVETRDASGNKKRGTLIRLEKSILKRRELDAADAQQLAELFVRGRILNSARGNADLLPILLTRDLRAVATLSKISTRLALSSHEETIKRNVYELFILLTQFIGFMGWGRGDLVVHDPDRALRRKTFALDLDTGIMTNPLDQSRNVSFKAITFGVMLGNICSDFLTRTSHGSVADALLIPKPASDLMADILFRAGSHAGTRFGHALAAEVSSEIPISQKIDLWCRFDTSVGWGRFENALVNREYSHHLSGSIILHNNFLTVDRKPADVNICSLMTGYISGVLSAMLSFSVHVTHDASAGQCAQTQPGKTSCDFVVSDLSSDT